MFSTWVKPCAMTLALYFWMVPSGPHLMQKTHLLPTTLRPFGHGTTSYTPMRSKAHHSSLQASSHSAASGHAMACAYVHGLLMVTSCTTVACSVVHFREPYELT